MITAEVFLLRIGNFAEHADGGQLAVADAARQDLVLAGCRVESPLAGRGLLQRDGKRKVVRANIKNLVARSVLTPATHLAVRGDETLRIILVFHGVAGEKDIFARGTKDSYQRVLVAVLGGLEQSSAGCGRRGEGLLRA